MSYFNLVKNALVKVRKTGEFAGTKATSFDVKAAARIANNRNGLEGMTKFLQEQRLPSGATAANVLDDAKNRYFNDVIFSGGQVKLPKGTIGRPAPAKRSMTAAQKKAMIARKRKAGPKGGMR